MEEEPDANFEESWRGRLRPDSVCTDCNGEPGAGAAGRDYIQSDHRPDFDRERHHALDEIDKAIQEIKHAAWDNGTNTKYAPPAAGLTDPWRPMRSATNWLSEAVKQINDIQDQQNPGLQLRATQHIVEARHTVDAVIQMAGH
jgi:hypothetical protein